MANVADGNPTKGFFVEMLTRDIELHDAILDLLDNCLDGVIRQKGDGTERNSPKYYSGYGAHIKIDSREFSIEDNCGGIPRTNAEEYAFRMGRSPKQEMDELPTVGIYGIGMKRAIFKIGKEAKVITRNAGTLYQVLIPAEWSSIESWDFPIEDLDEKDVLTSGGTRIEIKELNQLIANRWKTSDKVEDFVSQLINAIKQCYSFIIQKGFSITVNGIAIEPIKIQLLLDNESKGASIKPFIFKQTFNDVKVSLAVGFYAPPPSLEDIDDENNLRRSSEEAGWTVLCNDRVVLYNDKTHLTGWGETGVPRYHTQFIGIRGIVIFESNDPRNLPMTTTKRGIDTSSSIYSAVKDRMKEGLKLFTDYTNNWKGQNELERKYSSEARPVAVEELVLTTDEKVKAYSIKMRANKGGEVYKPSLPTPPNDKPYRVIHFNRSIDDILDITEFFYGDKEHSITPSKIGEKCFDKVLSMAQDQKR